MKLLNITALASNVWTQTISIHKIFLFVVSFHHYITTYSLLKLFSIVKHVWIKTMEFCACNCLQFIKWLNSNWLKIIFSRFPLWTKCVVSSDHVPVDKTDKIRICFFSRLLIYYIILHRYSFKIRQRLSYYTLGYKTFTNNAEGKIYKSYRSKQQQRQIIFLRCVLVSPYVSYFYLRE